MDGFCLEVRTNIWSFLTFRDILWCISLQKLKPAINCRQKWKPHASMRGEAQNTLGLIRLFISTVSSLGKSQTPSRITGWKELLQVIWFSSLATSPGTCSRVSSCSLGKNRKELRKSLADQLFNSAADSYVQQYSMYVKYIAEVF